MTNESLSEPEKEPLPLALYRSFVDGEKHPQTAEELMRARYLSYVHQEIDYIMDTLAPESRDDTDRENAEQWAKRSEWLGLEILSTDKGGKDDTVGQVEFKAHYSIDEKQLMHHERANFRKIDEQWYFTNGDLVKPDPIRRQSPKVGRNQPCSCGSGKKYKRCCM